MHIIGSRSTRSPARSRSPQDQNSAFQGFSSPIGREEYDRYGYYSPHCGDSNMPNDHPQTHPAHRVGLSGMSALQASQGNYTTHAPLDYFYTLPTSGQYSVFVLPPMQPGMQLVLSVMPGGGVHSGGAIPATGDPPGSFPGHAAAMNTMNIPDQPDRSSASSMNITGTVPPTSRPRTVVPRRPSTPYPRDRQASEHPSPSSGSLEHPASICTADGEDQPDSDVNSQYEYDSDELTPQTRARLQPYIPPGQYGPYDAARDPSAPLRSALRRAQRAMLSSDGAQAAHTSGDYTPAQENAVFTAGTHVDSERPPPHATSPYSSYNPYTHLDPGEDGRDDEWHVPYRAPPPSPQYAHYYPSPTALAPTRQPAAQSSSRSSWDYSYTTYPQRTQLSSSDLDRNAAGEGWNGCEGEAAYNYADERERLQYLTSGQYGPFDHPRSEHLRHGMLRNVQGGAGYHPGY